MSQPSVRIIYIDGRPVSRHRRFPYNRSSWRAAPFDGRAGPRRRSRELRLLKDLAGSVERSPDTDLFPALERAAPHLAAVTPEELPRPVHLPVEVGPAKADFT